MRILVNKKGFTLIEVIAVFAVFSLVSLVLFSVLTFGLQLWRNTETANDIRQTARHVIESILWDIRTASMVKAYDSNHEIISKQNVIEAYMINASGSQDTIVYSHSPSSKQSDKIGKIYRNHNQAALYVDKFEIVRVSPTLIDINFSFSKGSSKLRFTTSVDLSHKVIK